MVPDAFIPLGQVPTTASRLERAADELRSRADSPSAVPSLPLTLSHLERALDELGHACVSWPRPPWSGPAQTARSPTRARLHQRRMPHA